VIIGGLYWRRGTTAAAWSALITGSTIAVAGIVVHRRVDDFFINGQVFWGIAMGASIVVYVAVSLAGERVEFDLDGLLHRRDRIGAAETRIVDPEPSRAFRILGMGREFTRGDRVIYVATYAWTGIWTLIFVVGTVYNLGRDVADAVWADFWQFYLYSQLAAAVVVIVWFTLGGCRDLLAMRRSLQSMERDPTDDGTVRGSRA
jgi:SSS family solute:Na+ symporter